MKITDVTKKGLFGHIYVGFKGEENPSRSTYAISVLEEKYLELQILVNSSQEKPPPEILNNLNSLVVTINFLAAGVAP